MRRALRLACFLATAGAPSVGLAQAPAATETSVAQDPPATPEGEESAELRALRLAELELFGRDQPLIHLAPTTPRSLRLSAPAAVTSDAPLAREAQGATGQARDLSWLEGMTLPDLPIRWDDRVIRFLEFFRDDPRGRSLIRSWMRRVERFGPLIRQTLRAQGLPEDLLYVAMIESGFDPQARSDAGAVGLWQFVSRTGEEYGLPQDRWADMRMDPVASTEAGARYLGALHRRFGTWELAFAAYNMGYGALLRSVRKYDTNDYWELSHLEAGLPFETSLYVAKVMACAIVGRNPERFGLGDLAPEVPSQPDVVEVQGGAPLAVAARAAGTTVEELRRLNPALRRDRTPPGRTWALRLPAGSRDAFTRAWQRARPRDTAHRTYLVRFGEDVATIARRHRTTEAALRELNDVPDDEILGAGVALLVPAVQIREDVRAEPTVVGVAPGRFEYGDRRRVFYRVLRGDPIESVASFFRVSVDEIRQWNAVDPRATLQEGMFLQLFVPTSVDLARALVLTPDQVTELVIGSEAFHEHYVRQEGRVRFRYRVQSGDTLSGIATRFGLSSGSMARINQMGRDATLRVGQELIVYTTADRAPAGVTAPVEAPVAAPAAEPEIEAEAAAHEGAGSES